MNISQQNHDNPNIEHTGSFTGSDTLNLNSEPGHLSSAPGQLYGDVKVVFEDIDNLLHKPMKQWYALAIIENKRRLDFQKTMGNQNLEELATLRRRVSPPRTREEKPLGLFSFLFSGENYAQTLENNENEARRRAADVRIYRQKLYLQVELAEQEQQFANLGVALAVNAKSYQMQMEAARWRWRT